MWGRRRREERHGVYWARVCSKQTGGGGLLQFQPATPIVPAWRRQSSAGVQMLFTEHLLCTGSKEMGCQQSSTNMGPGPEVTDKGSLR